MKKIFCPFVLVFLLFPILSYAQNVDPQFSELKGMEDHQGNTHLFYRIYSSSTNQVINNIFHLNLNSGIDTIYLLDASVFSNQYWVHTYDFDVWYNNPSLHISCGEEGDYAHGYGFIKRFDNLNGYFELWDARTSVAILRQDDSLVFSGPMILKSQNGGKNWDTLSTDFNFLSLSTFNDSILFAFNAYPYSLVLRSTDQGNSFHISDTSNCDYEFSTFYYDNNNLHIYRTYHSIQGDYCLTVSPQQGDVYTWQKIYSTNKEFFVSLDNSQSGTIYIADGNRIIKSTDYGASFSLFKQFDRDFVGIYKKPNSDRLYAATKYKILEITEDSAFVIKSLSIPESIFSYYPLKIGNKWVYDYTWIDWISSYVTDIYIREVISEQLKPNGKKYFEILQKYSYMSNEDTVYERMDSLEGKIYWYSESCPNGEQFIDDLLIEIGDSTFASRFGWCIEHPPTIFTSDEYFNQWGIQGRKRNYISYDLLTAEYSLVSGIGLYSAILSDDNGYKHFNLKGCLIDGVVYGDTLTTGVDKETASPNSYSLLQNYPNPFNPSTKIQFAISDKQFTTLKVFNVLGKEIATLINKEISPGNYEVIFNASELPSGVYFYQLKAGEFVEVKKMILLR
ncbi:MAG: T9SS type A sorting domain-containing protein [Ignavibacteriaceae bacterium]|nr:T9SS type A sorting domain-containing protein [Ignavibacteriaceae bacterium]